MLQANREIASHYFKVLRAREEIHRLNIEIRRLYTAIHDEQDHLLKTSESLAHSDPMQAAEVHEIYHTRKRIDQIHLTRLMAIMTMPGYSGSTKRGIWAGLADNLVESAVIENELLRHDLEDSGNIGGVVPDAKEDETNVSSMEDKLNINALDELVRMGQFVEDIAVAPDEDEDIPRSRHGIPLSMLSTLRF
jgi:hypothetical protein